MINNNAIYRAMIEEIEDYAIILLDKTGNIINWNKGAGKIKGYTNEEIIGKNFRLFYTKEDRERGLPETLIERATLEGKVNDVGWRVRKDGSPFWGNILITAIHDENHNVVGFSKVTRDLTHKKNAEEVARALDKATEGFLKIFHISPSGMAIVDSLTGKFIELNQSFISIFGYSREEAIGLSADELGIASHETQLKSFGKLQQQGFLRNEDVPCQNKNGKKIATIFSVEPFELNNQQCFLCIFHDISHMKEMEEAIIASEMKYRRIIEEAGDVLYTTNIRGEFTFLNKRTIALTGYTGEELLGKHYSVLVAPDWHEILKQKYQDQFTNKVEETVMEFVILTKDQEYKWVEQVVIMLQEGNFVTGFQCVVRDITERKKAALLLEEQKQIIEQKNKKILDSINYAKRIQDAIFPSEVLVNELLPNSFILYKPKDIVSGDFYLVEKFDNKIYIAAVDCTGHGVPGALMSIVGYNLLSKSVNEHDHIKPSEILDELSAGINKTFRQTDENAEIKDSMDIAMCSLDLETNLLQYAGAYNSLYLIRKNELTEVPANRFPVGITLTGEHKKFTNHELQLEKGDTIYLFSDGYPDQFGGPQGKKLKYKGFKEILLSIQETSIREQKVILDNAIEEWKSMSEEQTDDILVIGIRIAAEE